MRTVAEDQSALYVWLTWLRFSRPTEYHRFRRYGTPSDALVLLAAELNRPKRPDCPVSLSTRAGQVAAYETMKQLDRWLAAIPTLARWREKDAFKVADTRRTAQARETARSVSRYVLLRAAHDNDPQPICAFRSIQAAVTRDVGRMPDRGKVRDALTLANDSDGPLSVIEWGERGAFHQATILGVDLAPFSRAAESRRQRERTDGWLMRGGHLLEAALRCEETARLTVVDRKATYAAAAETKRKKHEAKAALFGQEVSRMIREGDTRFLTFPRSE